MNGHPPWRAERALQRKSPAGRGAGQAMGIRHPRCPSLPLHLLQLADEVIE